MNLLSLCNYCNSLLLPFNPLNKWFCNQKRLGCHPNKKNYQVSSLLSHFSIVFLSIAVLPITNYKSVDRCCFRKPPIWAVFLYASVAASA